MIEQSCEYFSVRCIWLYVLVMSRTCFRVNPHSIVAWMSRNYRVWIHSETRKWHDKNIQSHLSDFHKMTVAVMKASFQKMKPKIITYRNYKLFSNKLYKEDLVFELSNESFWFNKLKRLLEICENTLNRLAARKKNIYSPESFSFHE